MTKRTLLLIAGCTLASAGCQPSSRPEIAISPDSPAASARLMPAAAPKPYRHFVKYRVTLIGNQEAAENLVRIDNRGEILFQYQVVQGHHHIYLDNPSKDPLYNRREAMDLNNAGLVIGTVGGATDGAYLIIYNEAFVWRNGKGTSYPFTKAPENAVGTRINNHNDTAGYTFVNTVSQYTHLAFFCKDHKITDLGHGEACGLNDKDQVVVCYAREDTDDDSGDSAHLDDFVWSGGKKTPIVLPPGFSRPILDTSSVAGINNSGQVAGTMERDIVISDSVPAGTTRAFLWQSGVVTDIGTLGGKNSVARAISNKAQIVGRASITRQDKSRKPISHAFLWQKGRMYDLNDFIPHKSGWILEEAASINDKGQIVGVGNKGAFLLTPISERPLK